MFIASFLFSVNPAGSYLSVDVPVGSTKPIAPTSVKLSDLGVVPGDTIAVLAQGEYFFCRDRVKRNRNCEGGIGVRAYTCVINSFFKNVRSRFNKPQLD